MNIETCLLEELEKIKNQLKKEKKKNVCASYQPQVIQTSPQIVEKIIISNESLHPYLNQFPLDRNLLDNIDDIVDFIISKKDVRPTINIKNTKDLNRYISLSEKISDIDINHDADYNKSPDIKSANIKKKLMDIVTDFINENFLIEPIKYYNFIYIIINIFESAINKYITKRYNETGIDLKDKIIFVFKGGNLLRAIFLRYISLLPLNIRDRLLNEYGENFKSSDLDFQIFIDPYIKKEEYEKVYNDMINLAYLCLNRLRNYYTQNLSEIFDFYNLKDIKKKELLLNLEKKMNKSDLFTDNNIPNNPYYGAKIVNLQFYNIHTHPEINESYLNNKNNPDFFVDPITNPQNKEFFNIVSGHIINNNFPRKDFYLTNKKFKQDNKLHENFIATILKHNELNTDQNYINDIHPDKKNTSEFYTTINDSVAFRTVKFSLIRTKLNIIAYIQFSNGKFGAVHVPGELIDISISAYEDFKIKQLDKILKNNFIRYKYVNQNSNYKINSFEYNSYSLKNYIEDLITILFIDNEYPWMDNKYEKRLHRIFILSITELFSLDKNKFIFNGNNQLNEIIKLLNSIFDETKLILNMNINYNDIDKLLDILIKLNFKSLGIYHIIDYIKQIIKKIESISDITNKTNNIAELKKFINILKKHSLFVKDMLIEMDNYINSSEVMHYQLESFNTIPNIKQKYLKYKQKYLNLKRNISIE
jgi:hypothetical protein